jgi:DNA-binding protein Fis
LEDVEKRHIEWVYKLKGKNQTHTKDALGIALNTLKARLRKYDLLDESLITENLN